MNDFLTLLQKTGAWIWNQKEKMVLLALLVVFAFRVYVVVNGPTLDVSEKKIVAAKPPEEVLLPPERPAPPRKVDYQGLVQRNPFSVYGISTERADDTSAPEQISLTLHRIVPWNDGTVRAEISSQDGRARRYEEGEAFENYRIVSIDATAQTVVVYSSADDRNFTLTAQSAG